MYGDAPFCYNKHDNFFQNKYKLENDFVSFDVFFFKMFKGSDS
jgi:hypothetical protein